MKSAISFLQQTPLNVYKEEKGWRIRVEGQYESQKVSRLFLATSTAETIKVEMLTAFSQVSSSQGNQQNILRDIFSPDVFLLRVPEIHFYILEETTPLYPFILLIILLLILEIYKKFSLILFGIIRIKSLFLSSVEKLLLTLNLN